MNGANKLFHDANYDGADFAAQICRAVHHNDFVRFQEAQKLFLEQKDDKMTIAGFRERYT